MKRLIAIVALAALSWLGMPAPAMAMQQHGRDSQSAQAGSQAQDHSCCPEGPAQFVPSIFDTPTLPAMPSEDSPCCARQAPSSPSLPATTRLSRPDSSGPALRTNVDSNHDIGVRTEPQSLDTGPFQLSSIRSTVLRN